MELNEYQKRAMEFAKYPSEYDVIYPALGLTGEAGEVADKVKKVIRDNYGLFDDKRKVEIAKELGDVLWYIASLSNNLGYDLDTIANINIAKLSSRKDKRRDRRGGRQQIRDGIMRQRRLVSPGRTVTFEGARYKAEREIFWCEGCAFANRSYGCDDMPMCVDEQTGEGVIFVKVEPN